MVQSKSFSLKSFSMIDLLIRQSQKKYAEAYWELGQIFKEELFAKTVTAIDYFRKKHHLKCLTVIRFEYAEYASDKVYEI